MKVHVSDINHGNNLFAARLVELHDTVRYPDEYLLDHLILTVDFLSSNVVTFKLTDGNHAFAEYNRRYPDADIIDIADTCFHCSARILDKYMTCCL